MDVDNLVEAGIGLTVLFLILGLVLAPIGFTSFTSTNLTASGITGTSATIWDNLIAIALVVIILGMVSMIRKK